jgi:hypothetical protein
MLEGSICIRVVRKGEKNLNHGDDDDDDVTVWPITSLTTFGDALSPCLHSFMMPEAVNSSETLVTVR